MLEHSPSRQSLLNRVEPAFCQLVEQRRGADQRICFQRERGHREPPGRKPQQVGELRAHAVETQLVGRPAQLAQDGRRVEDAAPRVVWPLALDQAGELHVIEVAEPRAGAVEHVHPAFAGVGREGLGLDPAAAHGRGVVERDRLRIEAAVRIAQRRQRAEDRPAGPQFPGAHRIV